MREILFRAQRENSGEWVEGYYACYTIPGKWKYAFTYHYILQSNDEFLDDFNFYKINPHTLGQYTGLTDSNNKKIFEGDIIRYCDWISYECYQESLESPEDYDGVVYDPDFRYGLIVYKIEAFSGFDMTNHDFDFDYNGLSELMCSGKFVYEVVGNIYDNSGLLEGGENNNN